jgi:hypothetical protein
MNVEALVAMERKLETAFPGVVVDGSLTPHDCLECDALRKQLGGITWRDVPMGFVSEHDGDLPLLSKSAYQAFLPAWLLAGIRNPDGPNATMLLVNLGSEIDTSGFTAEQAAAVVEAAQFMAGNSVFGPTDPVHVDAIAQIRRVWQGAATQQAVAADRAKPRSG